MILKHSIRLAVGLAAMHMGALTLIALLLPVPAKFWLEALVIVSMVHAIMHHALLMSPASVVFLKVEGNNCTLALKSGKEERCMLLDSTYVSPYLTVLNLRKRKSLLARSIVIAPDAIDREEFRQLRVRLRWGRELHGFPGSV